MLKRFILGALAIYLSTALSASAEGTSEKVVINKPSEALLSAVKEIRKLDAADFTALKSWFKDEGRQQLRAQGLTDSDIGGARLDTDKFGDAPLSK